MHGDPYAGGIQGENLSPAPQPSVACPLSGAGMGSKKPKRSYSSHANLWTGPPSPTLASLGHSLDEAGLLDGTGCPGVYKQSQRKGWGCVWGKEAVLPLAPTPFSSPPFSRGRGGKLGWWGQRSHTNQMSQARQKRTWGHSPLGCLREMKDVGKVSNTPKYPQVHICLHKYTHEEPHTQIYIFKNKHIPMPMHTNASLM